VRSEQSAVSFRATPITSAQTGATPIVITGGVKRTGEQWRKLERVCERLRQHLGQERFERYFDGGAALDLVESELVVRVPSAVVAGLLDRRFKDALRDAVMAETGRADASVRFAINASSSAGAATATTGVAPATVGSGTIISAPGAARVMRPRVTGPAVLRHRLDQFVIGACNRLAFEATRRLADAAAATTHNTLFIHGPCGTGKTHLLVGAVVAAQAQGRQARYVTGESLANEFISSVRNKKADGFRKTYRALDLLCIDDVQALGGKPATQTELQHTIDAILRRGGRVALAGPVHPRLEQALSDALGSRLLAGMVAGLSHPDAETAKQLVRSQCVVRGLTIDPAAEAAIVVKARDCSVRELEGIVTKVEAVHRLLGGATRAGTGIGMMAVTRALQDGQAGTPRVGGVQRPVRGEEIISRVCEHLDVQAEELRANGRHPRVVLARAVITHLCRKLTTMSYPEIARSLGRPNHSTVITAHQRLARQLEAKQVFDLGPHRGPVALTDLCESLSQQIAPKPAPSPIVASAPIGTT
jgi:chromosomal replication initiator protein